MKAYTDLSQSKELAKILPIESADMWYAELDFGLIRPFIGSYVLEIQNREDRDYLKLSPSIVSPCWSLAALLEFLPLGIEESYYVPNLQKEGDKYTVAYGDDTYMCEADNPVDACYKMIIKLHEQNLL